MEIEFKYDYFLKPGSDGNLTLPTTESRIQDAAKMFKEGSSIKFDDGVCVKNEVQLRKILLEKYKDLPIDDIPVDSENNNQSGKEKSVSFFYTVLAILLFIAGPCMLFAPILTIILDGWQEDMLEMFGISILTTIGFVFFIKYRWKRIQW